MKTIIREAKEINSLINAFAKKNPNINPKDLERLFTADPTTVQNSRGTFAGKYCTWIGNQYVNGKLKVGDIPELKKALKTYNINKSQITTPINNINSLSDLITVISDYTDDFKATRQLSKGEQALEKVYEDADWVVYIPHTYEASRKIGGDTSWCTASSDSSYFNMYTKDGPLYVNIRKSDGAKFQFHFQSRQFMDINDEEVSIRELGLSEGLVKFYETVYPNFNLYMKYDWISEDNNYMGYFLVELNNKLNLINDDGNLMLPNQWFDTINNYSSDNFAIVSINRKKNILNNKCIYILKEWVDEITGFLSDKGLFRVCINNKWNIVNNKGEYGFREWFDKIDYFFTSFISDESTYYKVEINNKYNIIGPELGVFLLNVWVDNIEDFGFSNATVITLNGKENVLLRYGDFKDMKTFLEIVSSIWFDDICLNYNDSKYAAVKLKNKWNLLNIYDGKLISDEWKDKSYELSFFLNESTITITKSDIKNMIMECVDKVIKEIYKNFESD